MREKEYSFFRIINGYIFERLFTIKDPYNLSKTGLNKFAFQTKFKFITWFVSSEDLSINWTDVKLTTQVGQVNKKQIFNQFFNQNFQK